MRDFSVESMRLQQAEMDQIFTPFHDRKSAHGIGILHVAFALDKNGDVKEVYCLRKW